MGCLSHISPIAAGSVGRGALTGSRTILAGIGWASLSVAVALITDCPPTVRLTPSSPVDGTVMACVALPVRSSATARAGDGIAGRIGHPAREQRIADARHLRVRGL